MELEEIRWLVNNDGKGKKASEAEESTVRAVLGWGKLIARACGLFRRLVVGVAWASHLTPAWIRKLRLRTLVFWWVKTSPAHA